MKDDTVELSCRQYNTLVDAINEFGEFFRNSTVAEATSITERYIGASVIGLLGRLDAAEKVKDQVFKEGDPA